VEGVRRLVAAAKGPGDLALASIHWGSNWGFEIPEDHRRFAHELIERAAIDIVHGHSSHHPRAIEVYRGRPILYGCGDLLNDYEGITGYEEYRDDLALMYFVTMAPGTSRLARLRMVPLQIRNFRLQHPGSSDRAWLASLMDRECRKFGGRVEAVDGALELRWA